MKKILAVSCAVACCVGQVFGEPFKIVGSRALAMGGAQVAVVGGNIATSDSATQYWNPAGLGMHKGADINFVGAGVGIEATGGILNSVSDIADSAKQFQDINDAQKKGDAIDLKQIKAFSQALKNLQKLNKKGLGMLVDVNAGVMNGAYGRWALSANYFASMGVSPRVELTSLGFGAFAPRMRRAAGLQGYQGIDFSDLSFLDPTIVSAADVNAITATPADSQLQNASTTLGLTMSTLVNQPGVTLVNPLTGTTLTAQQISNALVNIASKQGVSTSEIVSTVATIEENRPLIETLVAVGQNASNGGFANNQSNVVLSGIIYNEISFGHGREAIFIDDSLKDLYLGMNLKYLQGTVGYYKQRVFDENAGKSSELLNDMKRTIATSSSIGLDLGVLYDIKKYKSRAGLMVKNINNPTFAQPEDAVRDGKGNYELGTQARLGLAYLPFKPMTLALDYDLTENKTAIDGFNSRLLSAGIEYNIFNKQAINLALRGGVLKNMANSDASMAYTGGIGFNLVHFVIDLTGAVSADTVEIDDGQKIPSSGAFNLSLGLNF